MVSAESEFLLNQKRALRSAMSERRTRLAADERLAAGAAAAARLADLPEIREATKSQGLVAGFAATRGEIDPKRALAEAREGGARVAFPRVDESTPRLRFHLATGRDLRPGRLGILEPDASLPEVDIGEVAVMIVPGLAFDLAGNRLGFGGGYYDQVLAARGTGQPPFVVGLGYDFQIIDACPADEHDARVDCIVTDARVIRCADYGPRNRQDGQSGEQGA